MYELQMYVTSIKVPWSFCCYPLGFLHLLVSLPSPLREVQQLEHKGLFRFCLTCLFALFLGIPQRNETIAVCLYSWLSGACGLLIDYWLGVHNWQWSRNLGVPRLSPCLLHAKQTFRCSESFFHLLILFSLSLLLSFPHSSLPFFLSLFFPPHTLSQFQGLTPARQMLYHWPTSPVYSYLSVVCPPSKIIYHSQYYETLFLLVFCRFGSQIHWVHFCMH